MPRARKKWPFVALALVVVLALAAGLALKQKYYVKKFIKGNEFLYSQAAKVARLKNKIAGKEKQAVVLRPVESSRTNWELVFDAGQSLGKYRRFWGGIGFESFKTGVLSGKSRLLFDYIRESNRRVGGGSIKRNAFRYLRAHNLFSNGEPPWGEGLDIYRVDEQGRVFYDWLMLDQVFDRMLAVGFKPIVEFGFTPDALASQPDRRQSWGRANISPPKSYEKWADLVSATVRHLVARYGEAEVASWYFEVWNEPDLGWLFWVEDPDPRRKPYGDIAEYHKLYDHTLRAAKSAFPEIRIGGPASAGGDIDKLLEHLFIESNGHLDDNLSRIDFVSSHAYNLVGFDHRQKMKHSLLSKIYWKLSSCVEHDHAQVREAIGSLPFLLTETGPKFKQKHGLVNRGRYSAAWYAKMVAGMFQLGDMLGKPFQPEEVVLWASHQVVKNFDIKNGGIASLVKTSGKPEVVKLPIYNAIEALGHLSDERIPLESGSQFGDVVHAIATRDGEASVDILVYHINEQADEVNGKDPEEVAVSYRIKNLPFSNFELKQYVVDELHSNTYAIWLKSGKPKRFSRQQVRELRANQDLALVEKPQVVRLDGGSEFRAAFRMQAQSLRLLSLRRLP